MEDLPTRVDAYFEERLVPEGEALKAAQILCAEAGLDPIAVSPSQGAFLQIMAKSLRAKRILEIGTLGGYSAMWMAGALPADGQLVTLEIDPICVAVAHENLLRAELADRVTILHGAARDTLDQMIAENTQSFDLIFIDADKPNNPAYLERCIELSHSGTMIICDNVVRGGDILDTAHHDERVIGTRSMIDMLGQHKGLTTTALQTVGAKGYDGFAIALVD